MSQSELTLRQALDTTGGFRPEHDISPELWDIYAAAMHRKVFLFDESYLPQRWHASFRPTDQLRLRLYYEPVSTISLVALPLDEQEPDHWSLLDEADVLRYLGYMLKGWETTEYKGYNFVVARLSKFQVSCRSPRKLSSKTDPEWMTTELELE